VITLQGNQPSRIRMGEAGRRKVLTRDWSTVCDDLVGRYHQVMRGATVKPLRREKNKVAKVA